MKRGEVVTTVLMTIAAAIFIETGVARLPTDNRPMFVHAPVVVYSDRMFKPFVVMAEKALPRAPEMVPWRKVATRAPGNKGLPVSLTQYCLKGTTRRDHCVREGIVAADPRVFPLARYVEVFVGKKYLGKFLVDDTGSNVKGATLDIWTPSCSDARRFGRQNGLAMLVVKPER